MSIGTVDAVFRFRPWTGSFSMDMPRDLLWIIFSACNFELTRSHNTQSGVWCHIGMTKKVEDRTNLESFAIAVLLQREHRLVVTVSLNLYLDPPKVDGLQWSLDLVTWDLINLAIHSSQFANAFYYYWKNPGCGMCSYLLKRVPQQWMVLPRTYMLLESVLSR